MYLLKFIIFQISSYFFLMQIFRISTYHKWFMYCVPFLIGYGTISACVFHYLNIGAEWFWHVVVTILFLANNPTIKNFRHLIDGTKQEALEFVERSKVSGTMVPDAALIQKTLITSLKNTRMYFILSSIIYLFIFIAIILFFEIKIVHIIN
jgi:hypothetical protein